MAANYVLLERIELNASAASVTFSNIPQSGYTDLKLVMSTRAADSANNWYATKIQFNTDTTAANYPYKVLYGFGSTVGSGNGNQYSGYIPSNARTANTFGSNEIYIPNYLGSQAKSFSTDSVTEGNGSSYEILGLWANGWSGTAAINQIVLSPDTGSWAQYSTFSLYGLAAVGTTPVIAPKASGGNITTDGTYWIHTFNSTGAFVPQTSLTCDYLVVAGGGGGGQGGGGGGAGGYKTSIGGSALSVASGTTYTITVGAGGVGGTGSGNPPTANQTSGVNSVFASITSTGGGKGGSYDATAGANGGSGGGGADAGFGLASPSGQGNNGGVGTFVTGGGGGGAGAVGQDKYGTTNAGAGGNGLSNSISGTSVTYAGGGGGGNWSAQGSAGSGGTGGGGAGSNSTAGGTAGSTNTGGGGGGGAFVQGGSPPFPSAGNGGSGIVIIRYPIA